VVAGENAHGIAAETKEGRMAEGDQTAKPQRYVEADAGQRQDGGAGGERDEERLVGEMRDQRSAEQDQRQHNVETVFGDDAYALAGNNPFGLNTSTTAMRR
jgi:hypothetical protein